jgi:hypothetical protein
MADTAKKEEKSEESKSADGAELETTTANDGSLAINQASSAEEKPTEDAPKADAKPIADAAAPAEDSLIQTPTAPASDAPVVVSDADVAAVEKEADPHQSLAEQIEVLTGEVQALEAKIEKLTSGVNEAAPPTATSEVAPVPAAPEPETANSSVPTETAQVTTPSTEEKKIESPIPPVAPEASTPATVTSAPAAATPVNDIYSKILSGPNGQSPEPTKHKDLNDDATIEEGTSGIGTIGEVLIVFGLIAFLILAASPFFKSTIGGNWEALKSIGWPTATISLALGFLLFLFNKGRVVFKVLALLLTIVAAIMTAAVFDYGSMIGPLATLLGPIASFYK